MDKVILFGAGAEQGYNLALGSETNLQNRHIPL